jgi:hypothetical protein
VQDRGAGIGRNQDVLGAARDRTYDLSRQPLDQRRRHRPAQAPVAHHHPGNRAADKVRGDAAAGGFDFRELGHGSGSVAVAKNCLHRRGAENSG